MNGLLYLTSRDFYITDTQRGPLMCNRLRDISFVLFYTNDCKFCPAMQAMFKQLPRYIGGCHFGMVNLSANREIAAMSARTISKIGYVPWILLYHNGQPLLRYDGARDVKSIQTFIIDVTRNIQQKFNHSSAAGNPAAAPQVSAMPGVKQDNDNGIPEYTIGRPKSSKDEVCYLEFDDNTGYKLN